jgi:stage II sporulation protein P
MEFRHRNLSIIIILIIALVLLGLNIKKYRQYNDIVVPVWSSYDEEYYNEPEDRNLLTRVKDFLKLENILYRITRVRVEAPITYLKQEIPLLAYYTPEELKEPTQSIYLPGEGNSRIIQLKFNLSQSEIRERKEDLIQEQTPDKREPTEGSERFTVEEMPVVAIYHTHTSETYIDDPRNQDNNGHVMPGNIGNVGKAGIELARALYENHNIRVIHTTKIHDEIYRRSYYNSRQTVKSLIENNPYIDLLLDIHRDAGWSNGDKKVVTEIKGKRAARIMIVVTTDTFEFSHLDNESRNHDWHKNLDFANKLADKINELYPGLLFRVETRDTTYNHYNQDLHPHALLLEIGDYRNTTEEAVYSARLLADAIAKLLRDEKM